MEKKKSLRVSRGEMDLLAMFWSEGNLTLQQAHQVFDRYSTPIAYPTMQTRLNRMVDKGLLSRSQDRPSVYKSAVSRESVTAGHLHELTEKLGGGQVVPLVAQLISDRRLSEQEIDELTELLRDARKNQNKQRRKR